MESEYEYKVRSCPTMGHVRIAAPMLNAHICTGIHTDRYSSAPQGQLGTEQNRNSTAAQEYESKLTNAIFLLLNSLSAVIHGTKPHPRVHFSKRSVRQVIIKRRRAWAKRMQKYMLHSRPSHAKTIQKTGIELRKRAALYRFSWGEGRECQLVCEALAYSGGEVRKPSYTRDRDGCVYVVCGFVEC
jgi:hypothetical protein